MTDVALSEEIDHAGPCGCARDWYVIGCICLPCVIGEAIRLGAADLSGCIGKVKTKPSTQPTLSDILRKHHYTRP